MTHDLNTPTHWGTIPSVLDDRPCSGKERTLMKLSFNVVAIFLAVMLGCASVAVAGDERPIVAVFDIQTKRVKLTRIKRGILTELMASELVQGGVYRVMPPGDVKRMLLEQSKESYKECYDDKCQIKLGRQLPADKLLTTSIM